MDQNQLHIIYGNNPREMAKRVLAEIELEKMLGPEMLIGLKPNLVLPSPSEKGATTDPRIVAGIIEYLQEKGFKKIIIMEGSWVGARTARAFKTCGYKEISEKYDVPLYDLQQDTWQQVKANGLELNICDRAFEVDYLINLPVLKAHCQTRFTCALKNLKGCIPDMEKRRFHSLGLHKPIACLNSALKSDLVIVDAVVGDLTFEEGGNPVRMDRLIVGSDPVLVDSYGSSLLGFELDEISYIKIAESLGVGSAQLEGVEIIEHEAGLKKNIEISHSRKAERLGRKVEAKEACSACYGSLIHALQRLEEKGMLNRIDKINIGQGFKGEKGKGIGIGSCTGGFDRSLKGCPPSARKIVDFLKE